MGLCPLDSPLVSLGEPGSWKCSKEFTPRKSRVFINLFNDQWSPNFRQWNAGTWTPRIRVWSGAGNDTGKNLGMPSAEARFPLMAAIAAMGRENFPRAKPTSNFHGHPLLLWRSTQTWMVLTPCCVCGSRPIRQRRYDGHFRPQRKWPSRGRWTSFVKGFVREIASHAVSACGSERRKNGFSKGKTAAKKTANRTKSMRNGPVNPQHHAGQCHRSASAASRLSN